MALGPGSITFTGRNLQGDCVVAPARGCKQIGHLRGLG